MSIFFIPNGTFTTLLRLLKCAAVLNYCYLYNFHHSITYGYCLRGYFVECCCSDGGCCSDTWQKSSSSVWFLGLLACSIYLGLYHVFSSFLPNSKGWVDLRTELSSAVSCIKVVFYCSVKVRTRRWFWEEHCGHVLITPSGSLFQQVTSPQSPSLVFIGLYFSLVFSTACSLAFVSPSMSCRISACCLNQIYFQGVGMMSYFLGLLFPFNSWFSAVPWQFCHYTLQICGFVFYHGVSSEDWRVNAGSVNTQDPRLVPSCPAASPYSSL